MNESRITWNAVGAVSDANFDASSSLTEGLWSVFKHKISNPLAQLLLISDVWRVTDDARAALWCDFVEANYPDRLMSVHTSDCVVQSPAGFRSCKQPFGRLLASLDGSCLQKPDSVADEPLLWLLEHLSKDKRFRPLKEV